MITMVNIIIIWVKVDIIWAKDDPATIDMDI